MLGDMKKLRLYITALVLALAASFTAQAQVLRDANYNAIGRINGNGVVRDAEGHSIGSFDDEIFDKDGERIGYINSDGNVRDGESHPMGAVNLSDGKVTDARHNTLGYARGIRVDWIACYYLFRFFDR